MKAFITGATGFIGSHVLERLVESGKHQLLILLRPNSDPWRIRTLLSEVGVINGVTEKVDDLRDALGAFAPDTVLHLAWNGLTGASRDSKVQIDNLNSTVQLVSAVQEIGVRNFIGLGSQAEYGPDVANIREDAPALPSSLYGTAKLCANLMASRLCDETHVRHAWVRVFAVYGPRDNPNWLIPSLILKLLEKKRPALTPAEQRWDYLFVRDAADAICRIAESPTACGVFNLGSGVALPVKRIAEDIRDLIDPSLPLGLGDVEYSRGQIMHLQANIERLRTETGWSPSTPLIEGLAETIAWYREQHGRNRVAS